MKTEHFELELLTRCFLGGASHHQEAELRASSIRGQLRWWFRALGGFTVLRPAGLREQEDQVFGVASGNEGSAGRLRVQVLRPRQPVVTVIGESQVEDELQNEKYLLWPFAQNRDGQPNPRACLAAGTRFQLRVHWRGEERLWRPVQALVEVFGSLGALGTRSRRAMGALGFAASPPDLAAALTCFAHPTGIVVRQVDPAGYPCREATLTALAEWLRSWREHGRSATHSAPPDDPRHPGFDFALRDHDEGVVALGRPRPTTRPSGHVPLGINGQVFRAALGLPLAQRFGRNDTVNWSFDPRGKRSRFASPVILRPYRVAADQWRALVIFVDAHQWPDDPTGGTPPKPKQVFLSGSPRSVSRDLYDEMKRQTPAPFP